MCSSLTPASQIIRRRSAFTLVELLAAMAVFVILSGVLLTIVSHGSGFLLMGEAQVARLQTFRAVSNLIQQDLKAAVLPVDRSSQAGPQFILNPPSLTSPDLANPDALFWQTSHAHSPDASDIASTGYFVRWDNSTPSRPQAKLCRLYLDSTDPEYSRLYDSPDNWVNDDLLSQRAPATKAQGYRGLVAENVIGFWIAFEEEDPANPGQPLVLEDFDSRVTHRLPQVARISFAFVNPAVAKRIGPSEASAIRGAYGRFEDPAEPEDFMNALPETIRTGTRIYTIRVKLQ